MSSFSRRRFLALTAAAAVPAALGLPVAAAPSPRPVKVAPIRTSTAPLTPEDVRHAERVIGLDFPPQARELMLDDLNARLDDFAALREHDLPNQVAPALLFDPRVGGELPPVAAPDTRAWAWEPPTVRRPERDEDLAYLGVSGLAGLIRSREISSVELTRFYLARMRRLDPQLLAVVAFTEERALREAEARDRELQEGRWRGPLHGIPYGAKDLLTARGAPTTWGTEPYRQQVIDEDAAVVERLAEAGAVLVAKLTLGELAWGDVWFGGMTRNPWNIEQGASGSSAGPGAAVAAGMVPFAIGSETLGSIVSPSTRNGVTGHRPTFGRVSREGAMALSWTMDKLGPMTRSAFDAALVFNAIHGRDERDPTTVNAHFPFEPSGDVRALRVGFLESAFEADYDNREADQETLRVLRDLGATLRPVALPIEGLPLAPLRMILEAEASAAFDALTRTGDVDRMARQTRFAWPNVFRHARFIPAVEYINANRVRTELLHRMADFFADLDVLVSPSFGGGTLLLTNLTGHPAVAVPNAFLPVEGEALRRDPRSISFVGGLYRDHHPLRLAHAYQQATDFHRQRPPIA